MKIKWINLFVLTAIITTVVSCKSDKKNKTEATVAEKVTEAPVAAISYKVDGSSSIIEWTGKKPTEGHTGTIKISDGTIKTKEGKIQSGSFVIDMASINVTDLKGEQKETLEGHLKGEGEGKEDHFFNVAKFPNASFDLTGISEKNKKTILEGNLTIKGIKKNISFPASSSVEGSMILLNSEVFTINRTDWGVNYGSKSIFENLGDKFIYDDIELKVSLRAKKA